MSKSVLIIWYYLFKHMFAKFFKEVIMENFEVVLSLAGTAFSLLVTSVIFVIRMVKALKERNSMQSLSCLYDAIAPLMEIAEGFTGYSGEEKKQFVLTKVNQFAIENGIKFDAAATAAQVEKLIGLSKKINAKTEKGE